MTRSRRALVALLVTVMALGLTAQLVAYANFNVPAAEPQQ